MTTLPSLITVMKVHLNVLQFFFSHSHLILSWTTSVFIPCVTCCQFSATGYCQSVHLHIALWNGYCGFFTGLKRPKREAVHCTPTIAWVKYVCRRNSTPFCAFSTCELPAWIFGTVAVGCAAD